MFSLIWSLIIGGIIGALAGFILDRDAPAGVLGNILFGFLGGWVGTELMGDWGPVIGGFAFIPALIGAIICIAIFSFFFSRKRR